MRDRASLPLNGFSAAQLAELAGKGRDTIRPDIEALETLGLIQRWSTGKRARYVPQPDADLARAIRVVLTAVDRVADTSAVNPVDDIPA